MINVILLAKMSVTSIGIGSFFYTASFILSNHFIGTWCRGSTRDFGSLSPSSNLGVPTKFAR